MHQPAWSLYDAIKLAGIEPTATGYAIMPHLPFAHFSLRFPEVGLAYEARRVRGYVVPQRASLMRFEVQLPAGARKGSPVTWANGRRVPHTLSGRAARGRIRAEARRAHDRDHAARGRGPVVVGGARDGAVPGAPRGRGAPAARGPAGAGPALRSRGERLGRRADGAPRPDCVAVRR